MSLTALDFEQIRQTIARYAHAIDFGRTEDLAATFTEDGTIQLLGLPSESALAGVFRGRAAIARFGALVHAGSRSRSRHWPQLPVVDEIAPGHVRLTSCLGVVRAGELPDAGLIMTGVYHDEMRKVGERWLFSSRAFQADPQTDED